MTQPQGVPETSWEVFDDCPTCGVGKGDACCNLKLSTSKNLVRIALPHRGRPRVVWEPR